MDHLEPDPCLALAATYERTIHASLAHVWENVLDWEHLPWLHARAFTSIELLEAGDWGWRALLGGESSGRTPAAPSVVELRVDHHANRYVARTGGTVGQGDASASGQRHGATSEIWTSLEPLAVDRTGIRVEFRVQPLPHDALEAVGRGYVGLYTVLWDEDEEMMRERAERQRELESPAPAEALDLGPLDELRARLPLDVTFAGRPHRVIELGGEIVAHTTACPHMLGPLHPADGDAATLECPWHGHAFDVRSGRSCDGRGRWLSSPPSVVVDEGTGHCRLEPA